MWEVQQKVGIDCSKYLGHNFRIGTTTTTAAKGIQNSVVKTMGRWESGISAVHQNTPSSATLGVPSIGHN